jgi:cytochrome oxidase Cu insertion factor (SCO1/SenC/PrrC family)
MSDLVFVIIMLCFIVLMVIVIFLILFGDSIHETQELDKFYRKKVKEHINADLSESDYLLLDKLCSTLTPTELSQLNEILLKLGRLEDRIVQE